MTLLEVVLAASIMGGAVVLILTGYSRMAAAAGVMNEYRQATELLEMKLGEIYAADDMSTMTLQGKFADTEDFQTPLKDAAWRIDTVSKKTGLSAVTVTVSWRSNRGEESVSAATMKFVPGELAGQS
jgi:type II secretory pathway pseudopilin PulG